MRTKCFYSVLRGEKQTKHNIHVRKKKLTTNSNTSGSNPSHSLGKLYGHYIAPLKRESACMCVSTYPLILTEFCVASDLLRVQGFVGRQVYLHPTVGLHSFSDFLCR